MKIPVLKKFSSIACCGIDCGLCPTYYTKGSSRCPGCGGPEFSNKHPSCSILTCAVKKKGLETCADCEQYPCEKIKLWDKADSFVTHKVCLQNLNEIKQNGLEKFIEQQNIRVKILGTLLNSFNEGRSKSFFCIAATLLTIDDLNESIKKAQKKIGEENIRTNDLKSKSKIVKEILNQYAKRKNIELKLRRKTK